MKKVFTRLMGTLFFMLLSTPAFAEGAGGGYEGITAIYYSVIAIILGYGAYDIFFKKS